MDCKSAHSQRSIFHSLKQLPDTFHCLYSCILVVNNSLQWKMTSHSRQAKELCDVKVWEKKKRDISLFLPFPLPWRCNYLHVLFLWRDSNLELLHFPGTTVWRISKPCGKEGASYKAVARDDRTSTRTVYNKERLLPSFPPEEHGSCKVKSKERRCLEHPLFANLPGPNLRVLRFPGNSRRHP